MRIFTLRRMLGLTAIGVAYVHGKRGGDVTIASVSDTLRYLWSSAAERIGVDTRPQPRAGMAPRPGAPKVTAPNGLERNPRPQGG